MNVDFGKGATAVQEPQTQAVVPATPTAVAPATALLGDKIPSFDEIILPRVNLVQNTGKLKDTFEPGSLILGQQMVLFCPPDIDLQTGNVRRAATPPATITVLGFRPTRFCEKVEGGARGLIVSSEEQVRAAGGTLDYNEWKLKRAQGMKRFETLADAAVLIERPEAAADDDTVFIFPADGKKYALALWGMRGTSYTHAAKKVFFTQRATGCLRVGGYPSFAFSVSARQEVYQNNPYWIPVAVAKEKSKPEFLELAKAILGGSLQPPSASPEDANAGE
jgi:hypothetical protein